MKASQIIAECDTIKPNDYSYNQKRKWLNKIESDIREAACLYSNQEPDTTFISEENPELLLDETESDIYIYYIISMIDLSNQEYSLYNNSSTFFNTMFDNWKRKWRRKNRPECETAIEI